MNQILSKKNFFILFLLLSASSLFAATATDDPFSIVDKVVEVLQGPFAKGVVILAIIGAGFNMILQKGQGSKIIFISILGGAAIIFGATWFFKTFFGA